MQLLVCRNGSIELLFAYITPGTDAITDNLNVKLCHAAQSWPEHSQGIASVGGASRL